MTGTGTNAADPSAFYVLTALLLTPTQFPSVLADDYPAACGLLGIEPWESGYGLLLGQDSEGARWTVVSDDAALVACAIAAWDCGMPYDLTPPEKTVVTSLPGWPVPLAVATPGLPEPHDPPAEPGGPAVLRPPDPAAWGPAQRRLAADEVDREWRVWRERVAGSVAVEEPSADPAEPGADRTADQPAGGAALSAAPGPRDLPGGPVGRVLREADAYLSTPPPAGRVRSAPAGGGARSVRADGPGWSLVARTDDMALVLLDEAPGQILPVGRGPALPGLLESLDLMARASAGSADGAR